MRGKLLGDFVDASGRIVKDDTERDQAFAALQAKYGWQMRVANVLSRLSGKYAKRTVLAFELV